MTVKDFLEYANDDTAEIEIYNCIDDSSRIITIDEAKYIYGDCELMSFDSYIYKNTLCLNIDMDF